MQGDLMSGKTSNASKARYNAKAYDRIEIVVHKGHKAEIKAAADAKGQSLNSFINEAIDNHIDRRDFINELFEEFEEDNDHFMATVLQAIKTRNSDIVHKAYNIMQYAFENLEDEALWKHAIEEREELNKFIMKNPPG